ncbi:unnamed protein product [Closterium sp. Naga37s-1]|nr:unnamed protein product [Closterium sp. Naga37s-1]
MRGRVWAVGVRVNACGLSRSLPLTPSLSFLSHSLSSPLNPSPSLPLHLSFHFPLSPYPPLGNTGGGRGSSHQWTHRDPKSGASLWSFQSPCPPSLPPSPLFCGARARGDGAEAGYGEMGQKQGRVACCLLPLLSSLSPLPSPDPSPCRCFSPCSPPAPPLLSPCSPPAPPPAPLRCPPCSHWPGYGEMGQKQVRPWELRPSMVYDTQGHLWHLVKVKGASLAAVVGGAAGDEEEEEEDVEVEYVGEEAGAAMEMVNGEASEERPAALALSGGFVSVIVAF